MNKTKKKVVSTLLLSFCLTVGGFVWSVLPQKTSIAQAQSFDAVAGQNFDNTDYTFVGYSLRFDETGAVNSNSANSAFRFKMQISSEMYTYLTTTEGVKTGTLIYPSYYLENGDVSQLTVTSTAVENNDIVPINLETTTVWEQVDGQEVYQSVCYLKEIPAEYYSSKIAVRGYLQVGTEYYYTEATPARSFSYIVNEEKNNESSVFTSTEKEKFKELFLKFPITIDGETQVVYYGDTLEPPQNPANKLFLYYKQGNTIFTTGESKLLGRANLTSVWADVNDYYSQEATTSTFAIDGIPDGITSAEVNGTSVACTTSNGTITVSNLSWLEMGENYLLTATDSDGVKYYKGFKNVAKIDDNVPYSMGDELLAYDFGTNVTIDFVEDTDGNEVITDGGLKLTSIGANNTSTVGKKVVIITDTNGDVHKITLRIFTKVLYTAEDATAYFFGTSAGNDSELCNGGHAGCYALGADIEIDTPVPMTIRKNRSFVGLFDGCGHTLSWTVDGSNSEVGTLGQGSLFGYYMNGSLKNIGLDVTYKGIKAKYKDPDDKELDNKFYIVANYIWSKDTYNAATNPEPKAGRMDNIFFNVHFDDTAEDTIVTIGVVGTSGSVSLTNSIMVRDSGFKFGHRTTKLLFNGEHFANTNGVPNEETMEKVNTFTNTAGITLYEAKREYVNTENVVMYRT